MNSFLKNAFFGGLLVSFCVAVLGVIHSSTLPAASVGFAPDNVQAYWPLSDLPTYDLRLKNRASLYRSAGLLSSAPSQGHSVGHASGNVVYRQSGTLAVHGDSILVSNPGYLTFPLDTVRSGPAPRSFTLHGWMFYASAGPVSSVDQSPILSAGALSISSSVMTFGAETPSVRSVDGEVGHAWSHFALVVTESMSMVSIDYYLNGVNVHSVVSTEPWSGSSVRLLAPTWSAVVFDEVVLAASALSSSRIGDLYAAGIIGPCLGKPCFSGVLCTSVSSSVFQCGACPNGYHGDGIKCFANPSIPSEYRCFPSSESDLADDMYCSSHCSNRFSCFSCSMYYYQIDASLQERSRSHCETVFLSEKSATHTPTYTPTASSSASVTVTSSQTPTTSISMSSTATLSTSVSNTLSISISASRTAASTPASTPSKSPVVASMSWDLLTFPSGFTWYGGASLAYSMSGSFSITGDAGTGSRGLEYNGFISGDKNIVVSYYKNDGCSDAAISIFAVQSFWYWGTDVNRIQAPVDCNQPTFFGFTQGGASGANVPSFGWYTLRLLHQPSLGRTISYVYSGFDVNVNSASPLTTQTITESISGNYHFGISADQDNFGTYTAFRNLQVF